MELPNELFRRANSTAAQRGISFQEFAREALTEKLRSAATGDAKPWMKSFGKLRYLREETATIDRTIEEEFERSD